MIRALRSGGAHHSRFAALVASVIAAVALLASCVPVPTDPSTTTTTVEPTQPGQRIDLRVLVLSAADDGTAAMKTALEVTGVPYTEVDLTSGSRPVIDDAFLATTTDGARHSKFQAVVVPNDAPAELSTAERDAIVAVEQEFGLRQVDSYVWPNPEMGLDYPLYSGTLDGFDATVSAAARADAWSYLRGPLPFDDVEAAVDETYGYLSVPLPDDPEAGTSFLPFVTMSVPGTGETAPVVGQYTAGGRERLVITVAMNGYMTQFLAMAEGIVNWATRGVHLGLKRSYFTVHVDDVLLPDDRWSITDNCTPGEDCTGPTETTPIRMEAADVTAVEQWQDSHAFLLDIVYNGQGHEEWLDEHGSDPFGDALIAKKDSFRWVNHTYYHEYLGCMKDWSVIPWVCQTDGSGPVWASTELIQQQVADNITWAANHGISIDPRELVTGEHSGLRRAPEEPSDNPNLSPVLTALGIESIASDLSREPKQRRIGDGSGPRTLPRYPFNIFYNVATKAELVDEYNWIYNSVADGGSGICELDPNSTCISPLPLETGYDDYIRPLEARYGVLRVLNGWPYAHYAHQSNLAEERILLPVVEDVLADYRAMFAANTPIVNPSMMAATDITTDLQAWEDERATGADDVVAYVQDGRVTVIAARDLQVPLTVPAGSTGFGTPYAGTRSDWAPLHEDGSLTVILP